MTGRIAGTLTAAAAALLMLAPAPAQAQEAADTLREHYTLRVPPTVPMALTTPWMPPAQSVVSPTGFGINWGDGFVGVGFQHRIRYVDAVGGAAVVGVGFGNARDLVGLEVALTSFSTVRSGPFTRNGVSVKAHHVFRENLGLAVGWENLLRFGSELTDGGSSPYVAATHVAQVREHAGDPFGAVSVTLGLGSGRFRSERAIHEEDRGIGVFANASIRVVEQATLIVDWTGQDLALGGSIAPLRDIPLVLTPAIVDVTGLAGDGIRFVLGAGYGFQFADLRDALPLF